MANKTKKKDSWTAMSEGLEDGSVEKAAMAIIFSKSDFTFVTSERGDGFIDRLYKDGRRETGRLVNGSFEVVA